MSRKITRKEAMAIGENWYNRRNKLLTFAHDESKPMLKRMKAFALAMVLNQRCARIIIELGKSAPKKQFPPGGVFSDAETLMEKLDNDKSKD